MFIVWPLVTEHKTTRTAAKFILSTVVDGTILDLSIEGSAYISASMVLRFILCGARHSHSMFYAHDYSHLDHVFVDAGCQSLK